jgi:Tol biopolymer transport system component
VVSPDGRWMVFPAVSADGVMRYWLRSLDGVEARALSGAEVNPIGPPAAWSADSRWVIFADGGKLRKIDIQGGPPQNIADFGGLNGASSNRDGVLLVASATNGPVFRVSLLGGTLAPITAVADGEVAHLWPQFLPDGKHFLYERVSPDAAKGGVYVGSLDAKPEEQSMQRLLAGDRQAYYAPFPGSSTGHLIFMRGATLMAQPFDPGKLALSGEPFSIADQVDSFAPRYGGLFSVSDTGTLVYRHGNGTQNQLTWFDEQGNPTATLGDSGVYSSPAVSPDGSRVAAAVGPRESPDIWILDVVRGTSTRFTFDPAADDFPAWSPDGKTIAFSSNRGGQTNLYSKPADGSGEETLLLKTDEPKSVERFTKDGRFLLFTSTGPKTAADLWAVSVTGAAKAAPLLQTPFVEALSRVSPDGLWLAYTSVESGVPEIYIRPFSPEGGAGAGAKWLVSKGTGIRPIWRPDGKGLLYLSMQSQAMSVDINTGSGVPVVSTPRRLFTSSALGLTNGWDISPDGKRFLFVAAPGASQAIPFTVVLNWAAELKK